MASTSTTPSSRHLPETFTPGLTDSSASDVSDTGETLQALNDVAIVGMACRVAGGIHSPEQLWESILAKRDASSEIQPWRWEPYQHRDSRNPAELKKTTKRGYFLDRVEDFDPAFFGISPKEAEQMDPQQRVSLEVAWEALEDAGIDPKSLSGSNTAVFMGVNSDDYSKLLLEDLPNVDAWMGIGTAYCGIPNRISYHLNLMGASTAVDAACASSLVAVHHGHQAITSGQAKVAIAGGVNVLCGPGLTRVLDKAGAISPDGSCLSFDDDAHGYGRGEGAAIVILKELSSAIREGDNILAVLKGATVAQDGKTNGIMAPNAKAQELVARQALQQAKVDPSTIDYVEAHATSTPLGDPTEVGAISAVYGRGTSRAKPVAIGSVKPNVGHLEAGAGAVGLIKAVLSMNQAQYPPQANLKKLNSKIDWDTSLTRVVQDASEWHEPLRHPRRAAVCSYGYGGTVAHAIIEQSGSGLSLSDAIRPTSLRDSPVGSVLFVISAPQEKRLAGQARALATWLDSTIGKSQDLTSIANTLALRRAHHDYRAAFIVKSHEHAIQVLNAFAAGESEKEFSVQEAKLGADVEKGVVWVFSGHGAQWKDMGKELLDTSPVFCQAIEPLDHIVNAENGFSVVEALQCGDFVDASDRVQVLTYVIQVGLAAALRSKGLRPSAVIGHSVGEIAAAVAAGSLTPEEGALIVTRRAKLYKSVKGQGGMVLANLPFEQVRDELGEDGDLVAAIDSSPSSCVVSGKLDAVNNYAETLKSRGVKVMKVATDIAFHSNAMLSPLSSPLKKALIEGGIQPKTPTITLYSTSNVDARYSGLRDADYWVANMVNPVLLTSAVRAAVSDGFRLMVEVSSHPIVSHSVNETIMDIGIDDEEFSVLPTLRRNKSSEHCVLQTIAAMYAKGADVDFQKQLGRQWSPHVPGTQWVHKPIWRKVESGAPASVGALTHDVDKHTLLGLRSPVGGTSTILYTTKLDDNTKPFPGSHPLHGTEIVPAAVLANTFHHATQAKTLSNITLRVPVAISAPRDVQVVVVDDTIKIISRLQSSESENDHSWVTHTTGRWSEVASAANPPRVDVEAAKKRIKDVLPNDFSTKYLDQVGVSAMGFPWAVTEIYGNLKEMIAHVDVAPQVANDAPLPWDASSWASILDAATSVGSTIFFDNPKLRMPAQIEKLHFYTEYGSPPPKTGYLYVEEASERNGAPAVHVTVCDDGGQALARFESMRFSEIEGTPGVSGSVESLVHKLAWVPAPLADKAIEWGSVILVSDDETILTQRGKQLASKLKLGAENILPMRSAAEVASHSAPLVPNTAIVYCPPRVASVAEVPAKSEFFIDELLTLSKFAINHGNIKVFALTSAVGAAKTPTALAQAPLHGLSRIIASEHPDQWGALIDVDDEDAPFPSFVLKYVRDQDVVRVDDDLPRVSRLQPLPRESLYRVEEKTPRTLLPRPEGTYLITGGLGALGLKVAEWLVEKGARRVVLLSRRGLPPRREWESLTPNPDHGLREVIGQIHALEQAGATVHAVALDVGAPGADVLLREALDQLALPPVLGVVHAAGTLDNEMILDATTDAFSRVLAPKISGALALNAAFPVGTLDWLVLFSSCGQLFGFPGQGSYASGNAFLDAIATHRRGQGDNAIAIQWTSWRGLGMAASTEFINAELEGKGITDITVEEGFRAWEHLSKYDMDHGVVLRSMAFEEGEPLPVTILEDIAVRKSAPSDSAGNNDSGGGVSAEAGATGSASMPSGGPELKQWLDAKIRGVIAGVLMLSDADEVDGRAAIADLGVDSVMTVTLRRKLQSALKVKVPPTLTWSHPTANHLVTWFMEKLSKA